MSGAETPLGPVVVELTPDEVGVAVGACTGDTGTVCDGMLKVLHV